MAPRSGTSEVRYILNPGLVRVLGSQTEAYLRSRPTTIFELTSDTFEFLWQFREPRALNEVLEAPNQEQAQVVEGLIARQLLLRAHAELPSAPPEPLRLPAVRRFSGVLPWTDESKHSDDAIVILGAKFDAGTLDRYKRGSAAGPDVIRDASREYPLLVGLDPTRAWGFVDVESRRRYVRGVQLFDAGDLQTSAALAPELWHKALEREVRAIHRRKARCLLLGGDHSVSAAAIRALDSGRFGVVQFDAHTDFGPVDYASHLHHANVMQVVHSMPHVEHIVLCGVRGFQQIPDESVSNHASYGVSVLRNKSDEQLRALLRPDLPYYLSCDIDVLDASVVPGTTVPETDGLGLAELRRMLRTMLHGRRIVGADIVEVHADAFANLTARAALQVAFELIDLMQGGE
jgi:arginase family enzyme